MVSFLLNINIVEIRGVFHYVLLKLPQELIINQLNLIVKTNHNWFLKILEYKLELLVLLDFVIHAIDQFIVHFVMDFEHIAHKNSWE